MMNKNMTYEKVSKIGSSKYFVSKDKKFFMKKTGNKKSARKEFENLEKADNNLVDGLTFPQPVKLEEDKIITRYVSGENLIEKPEPKKYEEFGKKLREFHEKGFTHGHLQFNDVISTGDKFVLTDLTSLNEKKPIQDLAILKISIVLFKIKKPLRWRTYSKCWNSFKKGYGVENNLDIVYEEELRLRIDNLKKHDEIRWRMSGYILEVLWHLRVIR